MYYYLFAIIDMAVSIIVHYLQQHYTYTYTGTWECGFSMLIVV